MCQLSDKHREKDNKREKRDKANEEKGGFPTFLHCDIPSEEKLPMASGKSNT